MTKVKKMKSLFCSVALVMLAAMAAPAFAKGGDPCQSSEITADTVKACTAAIDNPARASEWAGNLAFRGFARMKLGDAEGALADFDAVLESRDIAHWRLWNGDAPDPAFWSGMIHLGRGDISRSLAMFDMAIQRNPDRAFVHAARAEALFKMDNVDWAMASQHMAVTLAETAPQPGGHWNEPADPETLKARLQAMATHQVRSAIPRENRILNDALAHGRVGGAVGELEAIVAENPDNQLAQFSLGAVRFMLAVERLGQALYRFGLKKPRNAWIFEGMADSVMFLRFPVPDNPAPDMLSYEQARDILRQFGEDLARVDEPLSKVTDPSVRLEVNLGAIALDFNNNGKVDAEEQFSGLYSTISGISISPNQAAYFSLRLDTADAAWLQGYSHLLKGVSDILLAYDWHEFYEAAFFNFFPQSGVPNAELALSSAPQDETAEIVDMIALIHSINWPLVDEPRMQSARGHFLDVARLSRLSWRRIAAETDNDHEWVPGPKQIGAVAGLSVTESIVEGWLVFLDHFEGALEGRILLPHWRYEGGINLKRLFDDPPRLDAVMWLQGPMLKPYIEKGKVATQDDWNRIFTLMNGDFFRYAIWFN